MEEYSTFILVSNLLQANSAKTVLSVSIDTQNGASVPCPVYLCSLTRIRPDQVLVCFLERCTVVRARWDNRDRVPDSAAGQFGYNLGTNTAEHGPKPLCMT